MPNSTTDFATEMTLAAREAGFEPREIHSLWKGLLKTIYRTLPDTPRFEPHREAIFQYLAGSASKTLLDAQKEELDRVLLDLPMHCASHHVHGLFETLAAMIGVYAETTTGFPPDRESLAAWKAELRELRNGCDVVETNPRDDARWRRLPELLPLLVD